MTENDKEGPSKESVPTAVAHSDARITVVMTTLAFAPFVQAFASKFGEKAATFVDEAARSAAKRFIRRAAGSEGRRTQIELDVEGSPVRVHITDDLPSEALVQLATLQVHAFGFSPVTVVWSDDAWRALRYEGSYVEQFVWDTGRSRWEGICRMELSR
jgi:leucyl aminopeptidase (aminopeptidase T)